MIPNRNSRTSGKTNANSTIACPSSNRNALNNRLTITVTYRQLRQLSTAPRAQTKRVSVNYAGRSAVLMGNQSRMAGNSTTSRIVFCPVRIIAMRSIPKPIPPVGGIPYSSAWM